MLFVLKTLANDIYRRFINDDGFPLSGNIAYCTILSLFPFLIFLTSLAGFFGDENMAAKAIDYLLESLPNDLVDPISGDIHAILTTPNSGLLTFSILFTLYTAVGGVESIRTGLNRAYDLTENRLYPFRLLQSLLFVVIGAVVLLALALLIVFVPLYWSRLEQILPVAREFSGWFHLARHPLGLGLMFLALMLSHMYLPARRHRMRELLPGVLTTMALWLAAAWIYAAYIAEFSRIQLMYAGLANVIITLVFLYISAALLILGGEINQSLISLARRQREEGS
jgi:membrane protein